MTREAVAIDLRELPELARLAKEVRRTNTPVVLRENGEDVAVLSPAPTNRGGRRTPVSDKDIAATLSVFGAWNGKIDPEAFKRQVREGREDDRPPVRR